LNFLNARILDPAAHNWYFNLISGCGNSSVPRVVEDNLRFVVNQVNVILDRFGRNNPLTAALIRLLLSFLRLPPDMIQTLVPDAAS
jgi:hypothetical protein